MARSWFDPKSRKTASRVLYGLSAGGMLAYDIAALTRQVSGIMGMCFIDSGSPLARRRMSDRPGMNEISFKMLPLLPASLMGAYACR